MSQKKKITHKKLFFKLAYLNNVNEFTLVPWLISRYQAISLTEDSGRNMLTCNVRVSVCPPVRVDFQNWHSGSHEAVYLLYITYFMLFIYLKWRKGKEIWRQSGRKRASFGSLIHSSQGHKCWLWHQGATQKYSNRQILNEVIISLHFLQEMENSIIKAEKLRKKKPKTLNRIKY